MLVGPRYIIAAIDGTVWSQSDNMADMIQMMANVCSTGSTCIGYIQLPVMHSQTSMPALLKRKRLTEDTLLKINADFSTQITLLFSKESTRACTDKRLPSQMCVACAMGKNDRWIENSQPVQNGVMGPFALCAVADMMGYDADSKPGASAGAEQIHGASSEILSLFLHQNGCGGIRRVACLHLKVCDSSGCWQEGRFLSRGHHQAAS